MLAYEVEMVSFLMCTSFQVSCLHNGYIAFRITAVEIKNLQSADTTPFSVRARHGHDRPGLAASLRETQTQDDHILTDA